MKKILVAVDGSKHCLKALKTALELAKKFNARLWVCNAVNIHHPILTATEAIAIEDEFADQKKILEQSLKKAKKQKVKATALALKGEPAHALVEQAEKLKCDVIVLGSRGLGAVPRLLLGSVSDKVVRYSKCAVIIVK